MSKQVNCVNIEPEILHGNWSSYTLLYEEDEEDEESVKIMFTCISYLL